MCVTSEFIEQVIPCASSASNSQGKANSCFFVDWLLVEAMRLLHT